MTKYTLKDKKVTEVMVNHYIYSVASDGTVELPDASNIDKNLFEASGDSADEESAEVGKAKVGTAKVK